VAPTGFIENLLSPWTLPALQRGTLALALPADYRHQQVAVEDLAAFVVLVLEQPERFRERRIEIAGDAPTGAEQAAIPSAVSGRQISYVETPLDQLRTHAGEDTALMFEWFQRVGFHVDIQELHRAYPEVGWQTFEQWARRRDWSRLAEAATA
jgi:uncharacterized protein YbjT (DUF2867 family)